MVLFGRGLTEEQQEAALAQLQESLAGTEVPGRYPGTKADAVDLRRFLVARDFDLAKTEAMVRQHIKWRAETFPVVRDPSVEAVLASKRAGEILGWNAQNEPVLLFDWNWGKLLNDVTAAHYFSAFLIYIDEVLLQMQERGSLRWNWLSIGGPPPTNLAMRLASVLEANYPELLHVAVIAPIGPRIKRAIDGMLWILPEKTKSKFALASNSPEACELLGIQVEDLPEHLRDIEEYERGRKANGVSMEMLTEEGHRQVIRFVELAAGKTVTSDLDLGAGVESVLFSLSVAQPRLLPSFVVGEHDARLRVSLRPEPTNGDCEEQILVPDKLVTVSSPHEQEWANEAGLSGSMRFELDNSHSRLTGKSVTLTQLVRFRKAAS